MSENNPLEDKVRAIVSKIFGQKEEQRPEIKMCPNCGRFIEKKAFHCSYCESDLVPDQRDTPRRNQAPDGVAEHQELSPVNVVFLICALVYCVQIILSVKFGEGNIFTALFSPGRLVGALGSAEPVRIVNHGEFWRWFNYMFLHGGVIHIMFNMSALAQLGPMVLEAYDKRRFWLVTFLTAGAGAVLSTLVAILGLRGLNGSVGLSGALFGYLGLMYIRLKDMGHFAMAQRFKSFLIWGNVFFIAITVLGLMPIDNYAHIGGALSGIGLALWFRGKAAVQLGVGFERALLFGLVLVSLYGGYRSVVLVLAEFGAAS